MRSRRCLIEWTETQGVFNDELYYVIDEVSDNSYFNNNINEEIKKDYLDDVFQRIDNFRCKRYFKDYGVNVETLLGEEDILFKNWIDGNTQIELLIILDKEKSCDDSGYYVPAKGNNSGYAIIYGDSTTFLIVGCHGGKPFVYHPSFTFNNTDSCTFEDSLENLFSLNKLKTFVKKKALEYIFEQSH
jgi:hypothetical protein